MKLVLLNNVSIKDHLYFPVVSPEVYAVEGVSNIDCYLVSHAKIFHYNF